MEAGQRRTDQNQSGLSQWTELTETLDGKKDQRPRMKWSLSYFAMQCFKESKWKCNGLKYIHFKSACIIGTEDWPGTKSTFHTIRPFWLSNFVEANNEIFFPLCFFCVKLRRGAISKHCSGCKYSKQMDRRPGRIASKQMPALESTN